MEVDKKWAHLLAVMTEDENGRIRATDERELMSMWIEDFFTHLLVFKEKLDERVEKLKSKQRDNGGSDRL